MVYKITVPQMVPACFLQKLEQELSNGLEERRTEQGGIGGGITNTKGYLIKLQGNLLLEKFPHIC